MLGRRAFLRNLGLGLLAATSRLRPAFGQGKKPAAERASAVFARLADQARARVVGPPPGPIPKIEELTRLSYDELRQIRYRPARSLWRGEGRFFEVQLFHRGSQYGRPVAIFVDDQPVPFDPSRFIYPAGLDPGRFAGAGYAGLRVHAPFVRGDYADELLAFLGASYFRAIGRGEGYGLSARCLAIDTGSDREEFPEITALHLVRPEPGDRSIHVVAEVRSARSEATFHFEATPGDATILDVEAAVHLRAPVTSLGLAPLTSMFLFGEEQPARFGDYRPEVHDSDGLVLVSATGEQIFRPLRNPERTTLASLQLDDPKLFALVQRDRDPSSYQDYEARYEKRPSAWVEPRSGFRRGAVRLLEITSHLETDDNIVAAFVPTAADKELHLSYRVSFGAEPPLRTAVAQVRAFRSAVPGAGWRPATDGSRLFVVDWGGADGGALETRVDATGGKVAEVRTEKGPADGSWRTAFQVKPSANEVELRAFLHREGRAASETLSYLWQPGKEVAAR